MTATMRLDIVSQEKAIFSGDCKKVIVTGTLGELGIYPGHTPLLTPLKPGHLIATLDTDEETLFYLSGGLLEVQPKVVTVLADTMIRGEDLDLEAVKSAKESAENALANATIDHALAARQLAEAAAQMAVLEELQKLRR